jgi:3-dehydroquinate synthase
MTALHVDLSDRSYDIHFASSATSLTPGALARSVSSKGKSALVVCDENVSAQGHKIREDFAQHDFRSFLAIMPPGEATKSLSHVAQLYDALAEMHADRATLVVAVGGGVIGDLAGFAAATYNRGLGLFMVPTTLLAMVDSSVGGKVGVNHPRGKNLIGAFHQPLAVWIDPSFLSTLADREYRSGLAEVVKYGVILDPEFFAWLETHADAVLQRQLDAILHIVSRSCRLKADVVEKDERETTGLRAVLNYGHTFAHAFETVAGYGRWLHGEAVSAGMVCAAKVAARRGLIGLDLVRRQSALLEKFGLPIRPAAWDVERLVEVMRSDKKNEAGKLRLILPTRLGEVKLMAAEETEAREVLMTSQVADFPWSV